MGYDRTAPKRPVNLNLDSDLIDQCNDTNRRIQDGLDAVLKSF
jgi:uncharacterized protein (DUF4415 family)